MKYISFYFVLWTLSYGFISLLPLPKPPHGQPALKLKDVLDVRNRIISFFHGSLQIALSGNLYFQMSGECGQKNTLQERMLINISVGYFLYDFVALWFYGLIDVAMVIHHTVCVIGMVIPLNSGVSGNFVVMAIFIGEISNPFLHLRSVIRQYGMKNTLVYDVVDYSFAGLFCFCRIYFGVQAVWSNINCERNHILVKLSSCGLLLHSIYFIFTILGILRKKVKDRKQRLFHKI